MARLPELIETPRLQLRRWTVLDTSALHDAVIKNTEHLRAYMAWVQFEPITLDDRQALIEGWEESWKVGGDTVYGAWRSTDAGNTEFVGCVGLHTRGAIGEFEIGYWIDQDELRRGFAREIASAATTTAFSMPGVDTVTILHDKSNEPSGGIPRTLGFTFDGEAVPGDDRPGPAAGDIGIECRWSVQKDRWATPCYA